MSSGAIPGFEISIDVSGIRMYEIAAEEAQRKGFPATIAALREGVNRMRLDWMAYLNDVRHDGQYRREVAERQPESNFRGNPLAMRISAGARGKAIEFGQPSYDMKPELLRATGAKKLHEGKNGAIYRNVMFRHGNPKSLTIQPMTKELYVEARKFNTYKSPAYDSFKDRLHPPLVGHGTQWANQGQRTKMVFPEKGPVTREMGSRRYHWATGTWDDMVKLGGHDPVTKRTDTNYVTWRRVSQNSPASSWWYPRIDPNPVIPTIVERNTPMIRDLVVRGMMADMGLLRKGGSP